MKDDLINTVTEAASSVGDAARVTGEIGALTRLVLSAPRVAKALAAPETSAAAKTSLLKDLTQNSFDEAGIDLVVKVAHEQRLTGRQLGRTLVDVLAEFAFVAGNRDGSTEVVETQLYEFANVIAANNELRDAFTNPGVTDKVKDQLVNELLSGKANPVVIEIVRAIVAVKHGRDVDSYARRLSFRAADLRDFVVAEVQTAIELDDAHRQRLSEALAQQVGKRVESRFSVDPSIIGSVIVRIGDEVLDGSVRHRLNQARQALLGTGA